MCKFIITILFITLSSCTKDKADFLQNVYQCSTEPILNKFSRNQLIQSFDENILQGIASIDVPDKNGAMGRNKKGYFHVRFQMGISGQADYAVYNENIQSLEYTINSIEYAFENQLDNGSFNLIVPPNMANQSPKEADLASGVSFFLSSLGLALNNFEGSNWYNSPHISTYKRRIDILRPNIAKAAEWLLTQKSVLEIADQNAPNRLFFNALSFYSLGKWLNNQQLITVGLSFASTAVSKKHPDGYFFEGDGWDSSYQGVAINVGFNLYSLLPDTEPFKAKLWDCLSCATNWQRSRVLKNGEITLQGNTRVYPGGEGFLGEEKKIDWVDTMIGFFKMGYYTNDSSYITKANEVKNHYY